MRRTPARAGNAFGIAVFSLSLIALLIFAALGIKIFLLIRQSSFDGKHQYSIEIKEPTATRFFVLNPDDHSIRTLLITSQISSPQYSVGVPIDATLTSTTDIPIVSGFGKKLLFQGKALKTSTTILDTINIFIFLYTTNTTKISSQTLSLTEDPTDIDKTLSQIFIDKTIYQEGESIAVINGTGTAGLGNKVARLFTHVGGNVVSVTTADIPTPISNISFVGNLSYTVTRISHLLHLPLVHLSNAAISDITVTLGANYKNVQ